MSTDDQFRNDRSPAAVLVTSDVSARGVDYPGVTRVVQVGVSADGEQYTVPSTIEDHSVLEALQSVLAPKK